MERSSTVPAATAGTRGDRGCLAPLPRTLPAGGAEGTAAPEPGSGGVPAVPRHWDEPGGAERPSDPASAGEGLFLAVEGIDGAGKTTAVRVAAEMLRRRGRRAVAIARDEVSWPSPYVGGHMGALRDLIWGEPPGAPYLDLGDEHWVCLQAAWYAASARCAVAPAVAGGAIVLADTWGYKFLAKLALRPPGRVSFDAAWNLFHSIARPRVIVYLHADPAAAATRRTSFTGSEAGNREGTVELSAAAFTSYQRRLAGVLESFAGTGGWTRVDASSLSVQEAGTAVADIAEKHLGAAAGPGHSRGAGGRP
jgi:thymidylate kinase